MSGVEDHIKTAYIGGECLAFVLPEVAVQLEQQLAAVTAELAEFRRVEPFKVRELVELRAECKLYREALEELRAYLKGEHPSILEEENGGKLIGSWIDQALAGKDDDTPMTVKEANRLIAETAKKPLDGKDEPRPRTCGKLTIEKLARAHRLDQEFSRPYIAPTPEDANEQNRLRGGHG